MKTKRRLEEYKKKLKKRNSLAKKTGGGPLPVEPSFPSASKDDEPIFKQYSLLSRPKGSKLTYHIDENISTPKPSSSKLS